MKLSSPYKLVKQFDINPILNHLPSINDPIWHSNTHRQKNYKVHNKTLNLMFKWTPNSPQEAERQGAYQDDNMFNSPLGQEVSKILNELYQIYPNTSLSKLMITALPSGYEVDSHIDNLLLSNIHRIHIPLITNEECVYGIDGIKYVFPPGFCFEFDNTREHFVSNKGQQERIHIILDLDPKT